MKLLSTLLALGAFALPAAAQAPCGLPGVELTITPADAVPGEQVLVTLTNNSSEVIQLPLSCVISNIHAGSSCSNTSVVYTPLCAQVITPISPGQSRDMPWDQLDDLGNPVPDGDYSVTVRYWDANFTSLSSCCVPFSISGDVGTPFCVGSAGAGVCPCGNFGSGGAGCANSTGNGALMTAAGDAVVGADSLVFTVVDAPANKPGLLFSGPSSMASVPLSDGLLCAGGNLDRIGVVFTDAAGSATSPWTVSVEEGLVGGEVRHYQFWYRDQVGPCNQGANTSNGLSIQWL